MDLISRHEYPFTHLVKIGNTTMPLIFASLFYIEFKIIPWYHNYFIYIYIYTVIGIFGNFISRFGRIFIEICVYIYLYIKLKLIRGLTSFNFFRWISMRIYHWNRILENLIRIAMHEIILYPRTVLYPSFIFYLSKNKKIVIGKFFYTLYKFLKLENLVMTIFLSIIICKVTIM